MMKRLMVAFAALMMMTGLATAGASSAQAAQVYETEYYTVISFSHAETVQISRSGISTLADNPAVRQHRYIGPDPESRDAKLYYIPGKGLVRFTSAQRVVNEAAAKPNGRLIVTINKKSRRPFTIWTQW